MFVFDEIGGEFWRADIKKGINNYVDNAVFTASGRSAQSLIIDSLSKTKRSALLPAYLCQHIVEPFAWNGWDVDFYDIDDDLSINRESLLEKIGSQPGCIVVLSYYGFNTAGNVTDLLKSAQEEGSIIIEDITHSFLSEFKFSYPKANFRFCSLRKWSGISDGGFATSCCEIDLKKPEKPMDKFFSERHVAREIKALYKETGNPKLKDEYLRLYASSEAVLDADIDKYSMSICGFEDFLRLDLEYISRQRKCNFDYLLSSLNSDFIKPIFSTPGKGDIPIMFPVFVPRKRQELRAYLISERIYCPIHWPMPVQLSSDARVKNAWIYDTIMSIPCDQRYTPSTLERMVTIINNFKE